jgi:hypothetical protein
VALLLSRRREAVRVCIMGLPPAELPRYLRAVGWSGSLGALADVTAPLGDAAIVHLDLGERVLPTIGLEYVFARPSQVRGRIVETALLDALVERGLCDPAKRAGLERWPGVSLARLPHELWRSLVLRRLNHVKVVYEEGRPLEAKAYLCVNHEFY